MGAGPSARGGVVTLRRPCRGCSEPLGAQDWDAGHVVFALATTHCGTLRDAL
jgi:hypothetical protein